MESHPRAQVAGVGEPAHQETKIGTGVSVVSGPLSDRERMFVGRHERVVIVVAMKGPAYGFVEVVPPDQSGRAPRAAWASSARSKMWGWRPRFESASCIFMRMKALVE